MNKFNIGYTCGLPNNVWDMYFIHRMMPGRGPRLPVPSTRSCYTCSLPNNVWYMYSIHRMMPGRGPRLSIPAVHIQDWLLSGLDLINNSCGTGMRSKYHPVHRKLCNVRPWEYGLKLFYCNRSNSSRRGTLCTCASLSSVEFPASLRYVQKS